MDTRIESTLVLIGKSDAIKIIRPTSFFCGNHVIKTKQLRVEFRLVYRRLSTGELLSGIKPINRTAKGT